MISSFACFKTERLRPRKNVSPEPSSAPREVIERSNSRRAWRSVQIGGLIALFSLLSARDSQAQYTQKYGADVRGDITLTGNVLVRTTNLGAVDNNNNDGQLQDVDTDISTTNSSLARLRLPAGATVVSAQLYWQSRVSAVTTTPKSIRFSRTGSAADYQTVTTSDVVSTDTGNGIVYSAQADITNLFTGFTSFPTNILAGGAQVEEFNDSTGSYGGWSLIVAYRQIGDPIRQLRIFDGFQVVSGTDVNQSITGFRTPDNGSFSIKFGAIAYEGDRGILNDQLLLSKDGVAYTAMQNAVNPPDNFFNSTISEDGVSLSNAELEPDLRNTGGGDNSIGLDIDRIALTGPGVYFDNAQTTTNLRFTTNGDVYQVLAFTSSIPTAEIVGQVFEDPNYGGGAGRGLATPGTTGIEGARVELYDSSQNFVTATTTTTGGFYYFYNLPATSAANNYFVRIVSNTVRSNRDINAVGLVPVQTFRTEATSTINPTTLSATPQPVTNRVGGENPAVADAGAVNTVGAPLPANAQSVTRVQVGFQPVNGVNFGFNFDTIVNTNDSGQGSLRQFILNSNALPNAGLTQVGQTTGNEVSIFMIPSTDPRFSATGPARIVLNSQLPAITGANATRTIIDGSTQPGDTNPNLLGNSQTVGLNGSTVSALNGPEIEISGNGTLDRLLEVAASNVTLTNLAFTGQNGSAAGNNGLGAIRVNGATGTIISNNAFGATTTLAGTPPATTRVSDAIVFTGSTNTTSITNNVFSQLGRRAILAGAFNSTATTSGLNIQGNQILTTGSQMGGEQSDGEGIILYGPYSSVTIQGNLLDDIAKGSAGFGDNGIEVFYNTPTSAGGSGLLIQNNTIQETRGVGISMDGPNTAGKNILVSGNIINNTAIGSGGRGGDGIEVGGGADRVRITQNSFFDNDRLPINLNSSFGAPDPVTPNDGAYVASAGNDNVDYPLFSSIVQEGANLRVRGGVGNNVNGNPVFAGSRVELYIADNTPINQNGEIVAGDNRSVSHGEGRTFLGFGIVNAQGQFDITLPGFTLGNQEITALTIDTNNNTSEFSINNNYSTAVRGFVYLDSNRNGTRDQLEGGIAQQVYVKLVPQGGGPAVFVAAADPTTGAYNFDVFDVGTYTLVQNNNSNPADVTPAVPATYVRTETPTGIRTITVVDTNGPPPAIIGEDFGLYVGSDLTGVVFNDNGLGNGIANNGIRESDEEGIAGITLELRDSSNNLLLSTQTDGDGNYFFRVPNGTATSRLRIVQRNADNYLSTGASSGVTPLSGATNPSYVRATDTLEFDYVAGNIYTGFNFGDVREATLVENQSRFADPGTTVVYPHTFTANSEGSVVFSVTQAPTPANAEWATTLYLDSNNNGQIDAGEGPISSATAIPVTQTGQKLNLLVVNYVPLSAAIGSQDEITLAATFTYGGANPALTQSLSNTDLTSVGEQPSLKLVKAVENITVAGIDNGAGARSGEQLQYTITYSNTGTEPITNLVIRDITPAYTIYVGGSATASSPAAGLTGPVIVTPAAGAKGSIVWTFGNAATNGGLQPGETGTVSFTVQVQ